MTDNPDDAISKVLQNAHEQVNASHTQSRRELLESLPQSPSDANPDTTRVPRWPVLCGIGTFAATVVFAMFWLFATPQKSANAIERIAQALDQIKTYSYRHEFTSVSSKGTGRTVRQTSVGKWRSAPIGLHATMLIEETLNTKSATPDKPKVIVDLVESHQAGTSGIVVDRIKKEYWWIHEQLDANSIGNPLRAIYMVRQRRGRIVSDLGKKRMGTKNAKGFEIVFDQEAATDLGKATSSEDWEWKDIKAKVWVDVETDLPIEFQFSRSGDDFVSTYLFTDLKWNPTFAADAFNLVAPADYTESVE